MRLSVARLGALVTVVFAGLLASAVQPSTGNAAPSSPSEHTCNPMSPSKVETGKLGETIYHFQVGDVDHLQIVPPENFDFLSASSQELQELGVPQRPSDPELEEAWIARMSHASAAPAGLCALDEGLPSASVVQSTFYGGVEASQSSGHPYLGGFADNRVFVSQTGCNSAMQGETSWVGVQTGGSNPGLLQNGVYRVSTRSPTGPSIFYESIWQHSGARTADEAPFFPANFPVTPGELLHYDLTYTPSTHHVFYFWQHENGVYQSVELALNASRVYWDGTRADFIDEKFLGGYDLLKYGTLGWAHAWVTGTGPGDAPGNLPHFFWKIANNTVDENLDVGMASSQSWNNYWHGCN